MWSIRKRLVLFFLVLLVFLCFSLQTSAKESVVSVDFVGEDFAGNDVVNFLAAGSISSSDDVFIEITPPLQSWLYLGGNLTIPGDFDPDLEGVELLIRYRFGFDDTWKDLCVVETSEFGKFSFECNPSDFKTRHFIAFYDFYGLNVSSNILEVKFNMVTTLVGISSIPIGIGVAAVVLKQLDTLGNAVKVVKKVNKCSKFKDYKKVAENLKKMEKHIAKAVGKGKLPSEILEPPYSLVDNLKQIREAISKVVESNDLKSLQGIKEFEPFLESKSVGELLQKSEVDAYLNGVCQVIENYENIKKFVPLKDEETVSNSRYCVPFISKLCFAKPFSEVLFIEGPVEKDFWFNWEGDAEPVKIIYDEKKTKVLHRFHWKHIPVVPYLDDQQRIQVFFLPYFHSPIVRWKIDLLFQVFVKSFEGEVYDNFKVQSREIAKWFNKDYYAPGPKTAHPPPVNYQGWLHADRDDQKR